MHFLSEKSEVDVKEMFCFSFLYASSSQIGLPSIKLSHQLKILTSY